ncbi:uncharacterized protein LOC136087373 [Hydra vulgaris]|uniref:Uncharacterized protein LOC136087373 n=1 Tax=Hydra vulgaris TaxID=6087 RepID=A0ABM4CVR0_HYDVU
MNHQKSTTHVVVKFLEKTWKKKHGKECIDVIPILWMYYKKDKLFCKYSSENEYHALDSMSKMSLIPGVLWKSFEIVLVKEAKSYEQGVRRMIRACSEFVVQSSNFEDPNSSEGESVPVKLSSSELEASLKDISSFKEHNIESSGDSDISEDSFVSFKVKKKRSSSRDEQSNDSSFSSPKIKKIASSKCNTEKRNQMMKNSSISHKDTRKYLNDNKTNIKERSIESSGDSDISKESFVSFKVKKKWSSCRDEQSNDSSSSSPKIKKIASSKCNSEKQNRMFSLIKKILLITNNRYCCTHKKTRQSNFYYLKSLLFSKMIKNSTISLEDTRKNLNDDKTNKKDVILNPNYKYCPTCGSAAKDAPASKANLESARRSIEYRIREEAKITRTLFSLNNDTVNIQKIITEQTINELPFNHIESFHDFDKQLKSDVVMIQKLKCFMILNVKSTLKLSENLSFVIPKIILPNIQVLYSAFGRESNGVKKLNFSSTETYKYLLEVITIRFPEINEKQISSQISRWFSGAKDRDGGKKNRLLNKKRSEC